MQNKGFFWHVHHEVLLEWCYSYDERAKYIRLDKPVHEQELRLRLFRPVTGALPDAIVKAGQAYEEAGQALKKAERAYKKSQQAFFRHRPSKARDTVNKDMAWFIQERARDVVDKTWRVFYGVLTDHQSAVEALHKTECLSCPWNGQTIFPRV